MDFMQTIDWSKTLQAEQYYTGHVRVKYILPENLTETEIRQNILYWDFNSVWSLFKIYTVSEDFMRQIQGNLSKKDLKILEQEIYTDCYIPRQCFIQQIENYLTYIRVCTIYFEKGLKEDKNKWNLLRRLEAMHSSFSYDGEVASFVDYNGTVLDRFVY